MPSPHTLRRLRDLFPALQAGDAGARGEVVGVVVERMRDVTHRMLRSFRAVRRWDDTDDVLQNAAIRFLRALEATPLETPEHLVNLATLQIRRELVDLARKHRGPESYAANHESNSTVLGSEVVMRVSYAADPNVTEPGADRWSAFHEAAAALPAEERAVFELAWFLGAEQVDVAEHLGCSVRTVKRRWETVKYLLRDALRVRWWRATVPGAYFEVPAPLLDTNEAVPSASTWAMASFHARSLAIVVLMPAISVGVGR